MFRRPLLTIGVVKLGFMGILVASSAIAQDATRDLGLTPKQVEGLQQVVGPAYGRGDLAALVESIPQ